MYLRTLIQTLTIMMVLGFVYPCYSSDSTAPGCAIDFNIQTSNYNSGLSRQDINNRVNIAYGQKIIIGIVAQNVTNIKLYQVKVSYPKDSIRFIKGTENYEEPSVPSDSFRYNILKKNNGSTIWMAPEEKTEGCITLANTLTGKPDAEEAPDGSGFLGFLHFEVINDISNLRLKLSEVYFKDISENNVSVKNLVHGVMNYDIDGSKKLDLPDIISTMKHLTE